MKVATIMGSISDRKIAEGVQKILDKFGVDYDTEATSAHRTPYAASGFASKAEEGGHGVIVGVAGKAAHLSGALATYTTLPVIGVPISSSMKGLDALLTIIQMPIGVPVATVVINDGKSAGTLAVEILAVVDKSLREELGAYKEESAAEADEMNKES